MIVALTLEFLDLFILCTLLCLWYFKNDVIDFIGSAKKKDLQLNKGSCHNRSYTNNSKTVQSNINKKYTTKTPSYGSYHNCFSVIKKRVPMN